MDGQRDQELEYPQEPHKNIIVCIEEFCRKYSIRENVRSKFGLCNEVEGIDEARFEELRRELGYGKRIYANEGVEDNDFKRHCDGIENSVMEGSTLEVFSQDLLWSQEENASQLIVSEDIRDTGMNNENSNVNWDPSITILESEEQKPFQEFKPEAELLRSEEFDKISSPPGSVINF